MRQPLYILSAIAISPQHSFEPDQFGSPVMESDTNKLFAVDAPYQRYISPVAIRRMSRIMKMTISAGMQALQDAGVATPDAIITGTGRGGVTDMESFVKDMIRLEEGAMNPTLFIQSTYNSPNGWIAMQSNSTGYNQTYVHRGCSFELAVQDAQMMMAENTKPTNILTGCFDELTDEFYVIRGKRSYWKKNLIRSSQLYDRSDSKGTIAGEGTAFFVFSNRPDAAKAVIQDLRIIYDADGAKIRLAVQEILKNSKLSTEDISIVLAGENGDSGQNAYYEEAYNLFSNHSILKFKHLCGEYDTASGFALWLGVHIISGRPIRGLIGEVKKAHVIKHMIIINHYILGTASITLLSQV